MQIDRRQAFIVFRFTAKPSCVFVLAVGPEYPVRDEEREFLRQSAILFPSFILVRCIISKAIITSSVFYCLQRIGNLH